MDEHGVQSQADVGRRYLESLNNLPNLPTNKHPGIMSNQNHFDERKPGGIRVQMQEKESRDKSVQMNQ